MHYSPRGGVRSGSCVAYPYCGGNTDTDTYPYCGGVRSGRLQRACLAGRHRPCRALCCAEASPGPPGV